MPVSALVYHNMGLGWLYFPLEVCRATLRAVHRTNTAKQGDRYQLNPNLWVPCFISVLGNIIFMMDIDMFVLIKQIWLIRDLYYFTFTSVIWGLEIKDKMYNEHAFFICSRMKPYLNAASINSLLKPRSNYVSLGLFIHNGGMPK